MGKDNLLEVTVESFDSAFSEVFKLKRNEVRQYLRRSMSKKAADRLEETLGRTVREILKPLSIISDRETAEVECTIIDLCMDIAMIMIDISIDTAIKKSGEISQMDIGNRLVTIAKNIDWKLLREQKLELLSGKFSESVMGIVHIIDDIQDAVVDAKLVTEDEVFDTPEILNDR